MRILFASYHAYPDTSNGAAHSMRTILGYLAKNGHTVRVLAGPILDTVWNAHQGTLAARLHERVVGVPSGTTANLFAFEASSGVQGILFDTPGSLAGTPEAEDAFLALYASALVEEKPVVVITYGGKRVHRTILRMARDAGAATVFRIANFAYPNKDLFACADGVLVPSDFVAKHYRKVMALDTHAIPPPIEGDRLLLDKHAPEFLTYLSPCPDKGVHWAGRVISVLAARRPDIPVLVVAGRGAMQLLAGLGIDWSKTSSIHMMPAVADPRSFYARTRAVLMPSLVEAAGRVARECCILGIPVLASNRGGLPEMLEGAAETLAIPSEYTAHTTKVPTEAEVSHWVLAVEKLWDHRGAYAEARERALRAGARCTIEALGPRYAKYIEDVARRCGGRRSSMPEVPSHPAIRAREALRRGEGVVIRATDDKRSAAPSPVPWPAPRG